MTTVKSAAMRVCESGVSLKVRRNISCKSHQCSWWIVQALPTKDGGCPPRFWSTALAEFVGIESYPQSHTCESIRPAGLIRTDRSCDHHP